MFDKPHIVFIYEGGESNIDINTICVKVELNKIKKKYFVYAGSNEYLESGKVI